MVSWQRKRGLVTWTYGVPARPGEAAIRCLERVVSALVTVTEPFAHVARLEVTTEERGDDAFVFDEPARDLHAVRAALRSEPPRRVLAVLDLAVTYASGESEALAGAARVYIDVDDQSSLDNSVAVWFVLDVDIYAPISWGERRDNAELAGINGPRLTGFLQRLQSELDARLEEIDVGDYAGHVDATGFHA